MAFFRLIHSGMYFLEPINLTKSFFHLLFSMEALYGFDYLIILLCGKLSPLFYDWFLFLLNYLYYFKIFNMIKADFVNGLISTRKVWTKIYLSYI